MDELEASAVEGHASVKPSFDEFVVAAGDRLYRMAFLLTRDHQLAEDLVQVSLSKSWSAWDRLDENPWPYVHKVLVNTYTSWWRRKWNGEHPHGELPETGVQSEVASFAERTDLWGAIGRLPRRQRAVVVLRYYEDLTARETAEILGCSTGNVKSLTSHAMAKLRIDPALLDGDADGEAVS